MLLLFLNLEMQRRMFQSLNICFTILLVLFVCTVCIHGRRKHLGDGQKEREPFPRFVACVGQMLQDMPGLAHFCEHMLFLGTEAGQKSTSKDPFHDATNW